MINRYKSALITGAASGIGYSILKKLSKHKLKIYALDKNMNLKIDIDYYLDFVDEVRKSIRKIDESCQMRIWFGRTNQIQAISRPLL